MYQRFLMVSTLLVSERVWARSRGVVCNYDNFTLPTGKSIRQQLTYFWIRRFNGNFYGSPHTSSLGACSWRWKIPVPICNVRIYAVLWGGWVSNAVAGGCTELQCQMYIPLPSFSYCSGTSSGPLNLVYTHLSSSNRTPMGS